MAKFIEVHNTIISNESISKVEFFTDDIYLGLFPKDKEGNILLDYLPFAFGEIELFTGEKINLEIDLYPPEDKETEEYWIKKNRMYINVSWTKLTDALEKVEKITGCEYKIAEV